MKVGYIGLGALGSELARRFLAHHSLCVWDMNKAAAASLQKDGATIASSAAEVAQNSDVILLCLPRSTDVHQAIFGPLGLAEGLSPGQLVIDQTSGIPAETRKIAERLALQDVFMMDAAVSASPHMIAGGGATLMVGGSDEVYERALPILHTISEKVYRCGLRVGDGQAMKMVNNAMNAGCRLGTLEVVAMGKKAGLSLECMTDVLNKGAARNHTTEVMLPAISQGRASTDFALSLMLKDVNQAISMGMDVGVPMSVTSVVRGLLQVGLNIIGEKARLEDMVGFIESMAATKLRSVDPTDVVASPQSSRNADALKVGFVGLGAMGGALAGRLMQSRVVHVYDARPDVVQKFEADGAIGVPDLASLARACDVIMLCLPNSAAVSSALFSPGGLAEGLSVDKLLIDQTSGDPEETRRFAAKLKEHGVHVVDAPVSGSPQWALDGKLAIMAGGEPEAFGYALPILHAISPNVVHCGGVGNGHVAKLLNNALSSMCRLITYECVMVGFKYGLHLEEMNAVINRSSGWSVASQRLLPVLGTDEKIANFQIQLMVKDLRLASRLGMSNGAPMTMSHAVRNIFEIGVSTLGGGANIDEMAHLYELMSGAKFEQRVSVSPELEIVNGD